MNMTEGMLRVTEAYCRAVNLSESRVATIAMKDGKFFGRVRGGASLTIRSYERLMQWFAVHWPDTAEWPADVPRPALGAEADEQPTSEAA